MFAFQTNTLNRHGESRHDPAFIESKLMLAGTRCLLVYDQQIACKIDASHEPKPYWLSYPELVDIFGEIEQKHLIYLGQMDNNHYVTFRLKPTHLASEHKLPRLELTNLRQLFKTLSLAQAHLCNVAIAIEHWHNTHQYCGYCGQQTFSRDAGFVRQCSSLECGKQHFPRTDSAVICAITFQDKLLLGRQKSWAEKRYSVIAGFVEPGETLEQAVTREAYEETGLSVEQVKYYQSQPWPFPQSLMVGFTAEAAHGAIKLLDQELEEARWFSRDEVQAAVKRHELLLPFEYSISRALINQWLIRNK